MINVSDAVITACNSDDVTFVEYIIIEGQKVIIKANLSDDSYSDGHFIGTFIMKKLEFETENDIDYKKREFVYYRQVNDVSFKMGSFIVQSVEDSDTNGIVKVTAYDYTLKFATQYKTELLYADRTITLKDVLQEVCYNVGVPLANTSFTNDDFIVDSNQFEETTQYGNVVSAIAQISGNFAKVNQDDKLELIFTKETNEIIEDYEELEDKRDTRPITIVTLGMQDVEGENVTLRWEEGIKLYGENYLVINDNPFAYNETKRMQLIQAIFDKVKGFGYSSFESKYAFKPYLQCGDLIKFKNKQGELINSIVLRINTEHENIELSAPSIIDATVQYEQPLDAIDIAKRTEIVVDKQNQTITSVVENVDEQNQKIAKITQTVDELNSKISDVADITSSQESMNGTVSFEKVNKSEPVRVVIRPLSGNISQVYPRKNLFPSPNLFPKGKITLEFKNKTTGTTTNYQLPSNLLYFNSNIYDEFILDYEGQSCVVNKRVGYNADGTTYALMAEKTIEYDYPQIILEDGDYDITLVGYPSAYLFVRLMAQNIYTTQFATKAELSSSISQTASEINLSVDKKLQSYPTTQEMNSAISITAEGINSEVRKKVGEDEIISKINQSAEGISINADKINIDGKAVNFKTNIEETIGPFTSSDRTKVVNYMSGKGSLTSQEFEKYDINNDGEITSSDLVNITRAISNGGYFTFEGTYQINPYSKDQTISIYNENNNYYSSIISLINNYFNSLTVGQLETEDTIEDTNTIINGNGFYLRQEDSTNSVSIQVGDWYNDTSTSGMDITNGTSNIHIITQSNKSEILLSASGSETIINSKGITTPKLTQTSLAEEKKNFEIMQDNALDIIKGIDIYKYNLKTENDTDKKHIGFVIGDEYNYSKEVTSSENNGVDNYSFTSLCCKAIQEQQKIIEKLQKKIKEMEEKINE